MGPLMRAEPGRDVGVRIPSSEDWKTACEIAERLGCAFPAETAGVALREEIWAGQAGEPELGTEARVQRVVLRCDACYGHCTVRSRPTPPRRRPPTTH